MAPIFHKLSDGSICAQYKCKVFSGLIDKLMDEIEGNYSPSGYIQSISHQGLGKNVKFFFLTGLILMTMIRKQCKQCIEVG